MIVNQGISASTEAEANAEVGAPNIDSKAPDLEEIATTGPDGETVMLTLLPPAPKSVSDGLAPYIREAGYPCEQVRRASQLQQKDGQNLDIFKIDCDPKGSYQATLIGDRSFFKPWTGVIFDDASVGNDAQD